jgi:hypothetical protein
MQKEHREFIEDVRGNLHLKELVEEYQLQEDYSKAVGSLLKFRRAHYKLVENYILPFVEKEDPTGSGGTNLKKFLGTINQETDNARK